MVEMELRVLILDNSPREQTRHTLAPWFPRPRILGTGKCRQEACGGETTPGSSRRAQASWGRKGGPRDGEAAPGRTPLPTASCGRGSGLRRGHTQT